MRLESQLSCAGGAGDVFICGEVSQIEVPTNCGNYHLESKDLEA